MEDLKNIIKEILSYRKELDFNPDDNIILDCATRIFNNPHIGNIEYKEEQATEKQINLLKRLTKDIPEGLTKKEASKLIQELKDGKQEKGVRGMWKNTKNSLL